MDYARIGLIWAARDAVADEREAAVSWQRHAERLERDLAACRGAAAAMDAGRLAQLRGLKAALEAVAPFDPVLRRTGRHHDSGAAERQFETAFADAHDAVARRHGVPLARRALTMEERAAEAEEAVLAEPIRRTRLLALFHRRWWWRGDEYRSEAGAVRAREDAARASRAAVMVATDRT
ncbi:hypothetical protein ASF08_23490 [Methylobacterium sp. Leaf85]|nr:hypothetical protein ASF08_23490 [Methylobacterium sp. Leaf85]